MQAARMTAALVVVLAGLSSRAAHGQAAPAPAAVEIRFTSRVRASGGPVVCALFRKNGWLKRPTSTVKSPVRGHEATCIFAGVAPGIYAIVAFHDANDNGKIDKNFLGIPSESWCTSRNAAALFGPPSFDAAKFQAKGGVIRLDGSM